MTVEPHANIEQLAKELDMPIEHLGDIFEAIEKNGYEVKGVFSVEETLKNLRAENAKLRKENQRLKSLITRWIPVSERLPEHSVDVLILKRYKDGDLYHSVEYLLSPDCSYAGKFHNSWTLGYEVTHWMPLPEPPKT